LKHIGEEDPNLISCLPQADVIKKDIWLTTLPALHRNARIKAVYSFLATSLKRIAQNSELRLRILSEVDPIVGQAGSVCMGDPSSWTMLHGSVLVVRDRIHPVFDQIAALS